jgi:hypothetical protein
MTALNNGEEAFKTEILNRYIELELKKYTDKFIVSSDIINWLVSQNF